MARDSEDPAGPDGPAATNPSQGEAAEAAHAASGPRPDPGAPFPVVGIGASAGGIPALIDFFRAASAHAGLAYVVIQHLPPDHDSLMAEILSRHTAMPVQEISDGMAVARDHVYVIRPGYTVTLADGLLHLGESVERRGHRRPVDDFFRSLADEKGEQAMIVILSGTGTNGTAGAQAIKAAGGVCIAQDPESAEFPGMPEALIAAGYADRVLAPAEIPAVLERYARQARFDASGMRREPDKRALDRRQLNEITAILRARTGHHFAGYKAPTLMRRIERRMGLVGMSDMSAYIGYLRDHREEPAALANDLMINVTGFFRDPEAWEALRTAVIGPMVERQHPEQPIRCWAAACASGEEAFTLAILIAEEAERVKKALEVRVFATDTASGALALARAGVYPVGIEGNLSQERLERWFEKEENAYRVRKEIRDMVVFAPQDALRDPPFSRLDVCTCRNLLIYLEPETQRRLLAALHFALRDGGALFLGNAESVNGLDGLFETLSKKWRIYRRLPAGERGFAAVPRLLPSLSAAASDDPDRPAFTPGPSLAPPTPVAIQAALLDRYVPPAVVVDANDRIVYFHGDTSPFLVQPTGEPTRHVFDLLRPGISAVARGALRQAAEAGREISVAVKQDGPVMALRLAAAPLAVSREGRYFRLTFEADTAAVAAPATASSSPPSPGTTPGVSAAAAGLEDELRLTRRELHATLEAYEANHAELKASHEELTSMNEELQSANEELETSKEELQSLNEELHTVNAQLQAKIVELEESNNDLSNLLGSTDVAVIFLDPELRVRRFTPAVNDLVDLIPGDVGRPIGDLAQKFTGPDLRHDARVVLAHLVPADAEVQSASSRWYLRRTLPYRTADNRIDGVVVTFIDITARKQAERQVAEAQARLQAVIEQLPVGVVLVEAPSGRLVLANRRAATLFGHPFPLPFLHAEWAAAHAAFRGFRPQGGALAAGDWPLARALTTGEAVADEEIAFLRPDGERGVMLASASPITGAGERVVAVVATFSDVTHVKRAALALEQSEERFRLLVENAQDFAIFMIDREQRIATWNVGGERITGWSESEIVGQPSGVLFTPEDRAARAPSLEIETALATGRALDERWHLRKDGSRFWASGTLTAVRDASGALLGFVKVMRDITDRRQTEERLREALQTAEALQSSAESANRAKDEFIATVSHELRTPLNTIRLWSSMLASGRVAGAEMQEGVHMIDRAALAQQQLIDDLLDISRMASGKLRLHIRPTRIGDAIAAAVDAVRPMAEAKGVKLHAELGSAIGIVRADPDRIQQVVWNLLTNAVKFTNPGGNVRVRVSRTADALEVRVVDSGIGIPREALAHVFDRFWQVEATHTRVHRGLGLGLTIVRQLVEMHGGEVFAESEGAGRGAVFTVRLPMPAQPAEAGVDLAKAERGEVDLARVDVLLIEDDIAGGDVTRRLLESAGARVRLVRSADEARRACAERPPEVIVSDIGLPGENGLSLLREWRDRDELRVPAIALSAFARAEDRQQAIAAGFEEHLAKPVDPAQLLAAVARVRRVG